MNRSYLPCAALLPALLAGVAVAADPAPEGTSPARGQYLVSVAGCNDCHTAGYAQAGGKAPRERWLTGSSVGFAGPWGTTYPSNLRLYFQGLSESEWLAKAREPLRPPMPWFALRDMSDDDLRALYRFVRDLGPAGEPAPSFAPPGQVVMTPYIDFMPKNLPAPAQAAR